MLLKCIQQIKKLKLKLGWEKIQFYSCYFLDV